MLEVMSESLSSTADWSILMLLFLSLAPLPLPLPVSPSKSPLSFVAESSPPFGFGIRCAYLRGEGGEGGVGGGRGG